MSENHRPDKNGFDEQESTDDGLETLPATGGDETWTSGSLRVETGRMVGPYLLVRELGEGGMGVVFLAEKADGHPKRRVALKLPKAELYSKQFLARFDREREILAGLNHPNIASLYDAGVSEEQPYLVLEFVDGKPITEYCDSHSLRIEQRLELFIQVLTAVQYAHGRLVIHRDLKPSNIFVTSQASVKLLDFGTAKIFRAEEAIGGDITVAGVSALTPNYASPEQLEAQAVTTATDIYSLGVVLFELLSGQRPFQRRKISGHELAAETASLRSVTIEARDAELRSANVKSIKRQLSGELNAVVSKAMCREPRDRYATADALAQDLRRYLAGEPVTAGSFGAGHRFVKFLGRHRIASTATALVSIALVTALLVVLWALRSAKLEARRSAASEQFLEDIFRANSKDGEDPVRARQTTARQLLDIGAQKIGSELGDAPEAKLKMLSTLEQLYDDLGLHEQAVKLGWQAVGMARSIYGSGSSEVAPYLLDLGGSMHASQSVGQRLATLQEADRILDARRDYSSATRAALDGRLGEHYQSSDLKKAEGYLKESIRIYRELGDKDALAWELYQSAIVNDQGGKTEQALSAMNEAIPIALTNKGSAHSGLPQFYATRAELRQELLNFRDAEKDFRFAFQESQKASGADHVDTIETEMRLGQFLFYSSRPSEGLVHLRNANEAVLRTKGPADPFYTPQANLEYGWALVNFGRIEEGLEYIHRAVENRRRNRQGTLYLSQMLAEEGAARIELGDSDEAARELEEAAAIRRRMNAPENYVEHEARARKGRRS